MLGKQISIGLLSVVLIMTAGCSDRDNAGDQRELDAAAPAVGTGAAGTGADSAWSSPSDPGVPGREDNMGVGAGSSVNTPEPRKP
jgi:hypothetical protein